MRFIVFTVLFLLKFNCFAQLFTKITEGDIVNTPSDSRSVNFADINNDGWEDIFITNGKNPGTKNLLYINNGDGTFLTITDDDIVSDAQPFDGATFADMDNDGDLDCFVVTWYNKENYFYRNNGDGSFTYESDQLICNENSYSETASWGDYDNDGFVDLYVTNSGGDNLNFLYHNDAGILFSKITDGVQSTDDYISRCINWVDYDNDNDADLFISNESNQKDNLYINNGDGSFSALTAEPPVLISKSTMSSSWGDINNDGDLDLFVSNSGYYVEQDNQLFTNNGDGTFNSVTTGEIVTDGGCSYGSNFGDYDNDGDLDLIVMNGYCDGTINNFLYKNDGAGNFARDNESISDLATPCSYGGAWGDVNNDGFLDLVIATCKNESASPDPNNLFYINNTNANNWIKIKLTGTISNASAIGAKIKIKCTIDGEIVWQMREVSAQTGYCGQNSLIQHFGLGTAEVVDSILIHFPSGIEMILTEAETNQLYTFSESLSESTFFITENDYISISPNPVHEILLVQLKNKVPHSGALIEIADTSGKIIYQHSFSNSAIQIPVKDFTLVKGTYFIKVRVDNTHRTLAFTVQ